MEKIGIITFSNNTNYGSWLQTYGLFKTIERKGKDVEVINYHYKLCDQNERLSKEYLKKAIIQHNLDDIKRIPIIGTRTRSFDKISNSLMKVSKPYCSRDIYKANDQYDIFLVGSDLVWDYRYCGESDVFFLDFVKKGKKLSYGASMGYQSIPAHLRFNMQKLLGKFDDITVREKNVQRILSEIGVSSEVVCDPTMLIERMEWKKLARKRIVSEEYVLLYMSNSEIENMARIYAHKKRLKIISIDKPLYGDRTNVIFPKNPVEFLSLILYAEKVFTGSYHGLLFSLYFNKNISYFRRHPYNRIKNLEDILGISDYQIKSNKYFLYSEPNWDEINQAIDSFRNKSLDILNCMI